VISFSQLAYANSCGVKVQVVVEYGQRFADGALLGTADQQIPQNTGILLETQAESEKLLAAGSGVSGVNYLDRFATIMMAG